MSAALDKVTLLMTITRQLVQVLDAETEILRRVRLSELADINAEKIALAEVYDVELSNLRRTPELLGGVSADMREELEYTTRRFREAAHRNTLALQAAGTVIERCLALISANLAISPNYEPDGHSHRGAAQIVPFALDRTC